jgi:hypothetical protein
MLQDDTLRQQLAKSLRGIHADIETAEIPPRVARLLDERPDPPPQGAPGQRIPRLYDELPEEAEAAEHKVA